jgi:phage virion morphogenesis protein
MANLEIAIDEAAIAAAFGNLANLGSEAQPLFKAWANHLEVRAVTAFKSETAPDGSKWAALNPKYAAYKADYGKGKKQTKPKPKNKTLQWTGGLYSSLASQVTSDGAQVGTNQTVGSYSLGAIHQFGAPRRNIPARPFLPLTPEGALLPEDLDELVALTEEFFANRLNR